MIRNILMHDSLPPRGSESRTGITCHFDCGGENVELICRIFEQSVTRSDEIRSYRHPIPAFTRVFAFRKGGAELQYAGGSLRMNSGNVYLLPAGVSFEICYFPCDQIFYHLHVCDRSGGNIFSRSDRIYEFCENEFFEQFNHAQTSENPLLKNAALLRLLAPVVSEKREELVARARLHQEFSRIFEYLEKHPPAAVGIPELAELYHIEGAALSKRFQRKWHLSLKEFLTGRLLSRAQQMLLESDLSTIEISQLLGFSDPSYFFRFFRKHVGDTPTSFRKHR